MTTVERGCRICPITGKNAWLPSVSADRQAVGLLYCGAYGLREDGSEDDCIYVAYNFHSGLSHLALPKLPGKKKMVSDYEHGAGGGVFFGRRTALRISSCLRRRDSLSAFCLENRKRDLEDESLEASLHNYAS